MNIEWFLAKYYIVSYFKMQAKMKEKQNFVYFFVKMSIYT